MRLSLPQDIKAFRVLVSTLPPFVLAGGIFLITGSLIFSILAFILSLVVIPLVKGRKFNKQYRAYIAGFGSDYSEAYTSDIYNNSIYGYVPFKGRYAHCSIYADENGVVISKTAIKRYIPWDSVVRHRIHNNQRGKYIELNLGNLSAENRLFIPWAKEFSCYLPSNS